MTLAARLVTDSTGLGDCTNGGVEIGVAAEAEAAACARAFGVEGRVRIGEAPAKFDAGLKGGVAGEVQAAAETTKHRIAARIRMPADLAKTCSLRRIARPVTFGILHRQMPDAGAGHLAQIQGQLAIGMTNNKLQVYTESPARR